MTERSQQLWTAWIDRRDATAFQTLITPELPYLLRFARNLGCSDADAGDAVQDALVRMIRQRDGRLGGLPPRAWLLREIRTRARSRLRSERRRAQRQAAVALPHVVATDERSALVRDEVERALSELDADDRVVVELRFLHDLEHAEIADVLGVKPDACRQRVHRALGRLRERLGAGAAALVAGIDVPTPPDVQVFVSRAQRVARRATVASVIGGAVMMMTKAKIACLVLAVIAVPLVAWGVSRVVGGPADVGGTTGVSVGEVEAADEDVAERDRVRTGRRETTQDAVATPESVAVPQEPGDASAELTLRVRVVTPEGTPPGETVIEVRRAERRAVIDGVEPTHFVLVGEFLDLQVDELLGDALAGETELLVRADRADLLPREERVLVGAVAEDDAPRAPSGVVLVTIELQRAAVVASTVVDEEGRGIAAAEVAAFAEMADGSHHLVDLVRSGPDGAFRVRIRPEQPCTVLAITDGRAPAIRRLEWAASGDTVACEDLVATRGAAISGVVRESDGTPSAGTVIECQLAARGKLIKLRGRRLSLLADGVAWSQANATTDESGSFALVGLSSGRHRVSLSTPEMAGDLERHLARDVDAPATDVDFDLSGGWLVIEVRKDGALVPGAGVNVVGHLYSEHRIADDAGRVRVRAVPSGTYLLFARDGDESPVEMEVEAPVAGQEALVVMDLGAREERAALELTMVSASDGPTPESARLELYALGRERIVPNWERVATRGADGRYVAEDVPPGSYALVVQPGGDALMGSTGSWLPVELDVEVPVTGSVHHEVELRVGGRVRLSVRTPEGAYTRAECTVRDASGGAVDVSFVRNGGSSSKGSLLPNAPNDVEPPLAAGSYRVNFRADGYRDVTRDIEVRIDETTTLDVTLDRE